MSDKPREFWKYIGEELAIFWINPWDNKEEKIASFWWPGHAIEDTSLVEKYFESLADRLVGKELEAERKKTEALQAKLDVAVEALELIELNSIDALPRVRAAETLAKIKGDK